MRALVLVVMLLASTMCSGSLWGQETRSNLGVEGTESLDDLLEMGDRLLHGKTVNFGVRAGFNSTMYHISRLGHNDIAVANVQPNFRVGYFCALFLRANMGKSFIQPELLYSHTSSNTTFDLAKNSDAGEASGYRNISMLSTMNSLEMPLLYGYNIVKQEPYSLALMAGPKLRYMWKMDNDLTIDGSNKVDYVREELYPFSVNLSLGVAVTISNVFFDFRYDVGLHNISRKLTSDTSALLPEGVAPSDLQFHRHENTLSFSIGVFL